MYDIRDVKNGHHDDDNNDNNFVNGISYGVGKVGSRIGREKREKEGELKQASSSFLTYLICLKVKFMIPVLKKIFNRVQWGSFAQGEVVFISFLFLRSSSS